MNESELAWAAGLFDGEGNAGFYAHSHYGNRTTYRLVAQMAQKDREVLDRFQAAMGVGNVTGPDSRNVYKWSITRKEDF